MSRKAIVAGLLLTLLFSCEDSFVSNCNDCYPDGVPSVKLKIYYRNPDYILVNPKVTLYEGAVDDGIIIEQYIITEAFSYIEADAILYKDYSATLEYYRDGRRYISTAGACPKTGYDKNSCDEPCYFLYDNIIDLRPRY